MSKELDQKMVNRNIPGMMNRNERFAEAEHAENVGATLRRIITYFLHEKKLVIFMLAIVVFGTLCGIYAPSLQSRAVTSLQEKEWVFFPIHCCLCFLFICFTAPAVCYRDYSARGSAKT